MASISLSPPTSLSLLVPAYIYPLTSTTWDPLFNAITANPSVDFYVVVNPNSGPDSSPPNSDYISVISRLNTFPSVTTLGYVSTNYTVRPLSEVTADINTYFDWSTYTAANISVDGIFFDEEATATSALEYYSDASAAVKSTFPDGKDFVLFNPGTVTDAAYYTYADAILMFENSYANWGSGVFEAQSGEGSSRQLAAMVHSFTGTTEQLQGIVDVARQAQAGLLWVTQVYEAWPSYLGTLAGLVAAAGA